MLMAQTIWQRKPKRLRVTVDGLAARALRPGHALAIIAHIGVDGATGHAIEFAGAAIRALSMEGRLTLCNMSMRLAPAAWLRRMRRHLLRRGRPARQKALNSTRRSKGGRR